MKKRTFSTGAVSILLIFMVLCLVAFGVLSCATAQAGLESAQTTAENTSGYYEACAQAEEELAVLAQNLADYWEQSPASYPGELSGRAEGTSWSPNGETLTLTLPISSAKLLTVTVRPQKPADGVYYEILSYRTAPARAWEADDTLSLLNGA